MCPEVWIDDEVHLAIRNSRNRGESDNDVLRRALGLDRRERARPALIGRNAGASRPKSFRELLEAGALLAGDTLTWSEAGRKPLAARVDRDGSITISGLGRFTSPSAPLRVATGSERNGWVLWRLDRTGETLHELRTRVQLERERRSRG